MVVNLPCPPSVSPRLSVILLLSLFSVFEVGGNITSLISFNFWLRSFAFGSGALTIVILCAVFYFLLFVPIGILALVRIYRAHGKAAVLYFFRREVILNGIAIAVADTWISMAETYAAGRVTILTQVFAKALEPLLTWLLAKLVLRETRSYCRILPLSGLVCIAVGVTLHMWRTVEEKHDEKTKGWFIVLYLTGVLGSSGYALAQSRYIRKASEGLRRVLLVKSHILLAERSGGSSADESLAMDAAASPALDDPVAVDLLGRPVAEPARKESDPESDCDGQQQRNDDDDGRPRGEATTTTGRAHTSHKVCEDTALLLNNDQQQAGSVNASCDEPSIGAQHASASHCNSSSSSQQQQPQPPAVPHADIRAIAIATDMTFTLIFTLLLGPFLDIIPNFGFSSDIGAVFGNLKLGFKCIKVCESNLLYAIITCSGWSLVYVADTVMNHFSPPLNAMVNQTMSPLAVFILVLFPALNAGYSPPESTTVAMALQILSVVALLAGVCLFGCWELRSSPLVSSDPKKAKKAVEVGGNDASRPHRRSLKGEI